MKKKSSTKKEQKRKIIAKKDFVRESRYANLTNDLVFRHYFSSNQEVLLSLLKSFLPIPEDVDEVEIMNKEKIQQSEKLILLDTSIAPDAPDKKGVVFDLQVKLPSGEIALIEMQNYWQPFWEERIMFYSTKAHGRNLKRGAPYKALRATYTLVFVTFDAFGDELKGFIHPHAMRLNTEPYRLFSKALNVIVVVLPQVPGTCVDLFAPSDIWCYILRHSAELKDSERKYIEQHEEFKMPLKHLDEVSASHDLSYAAELRREELEMWEMERNTLIEHGREKGMAEGIAKGIAKGIAEGKAEGIAKGREKGMAEGIAKGKAEGIAKGKAEGIAEGEAKKQKEIALRLLEAGLTSAEISKATSLSKNEIDRLNGKG